MNQKHCATFGEKISIRWDPLPLPPIGHNKPDPSLSDQRECENCKPDQYIKKEFGKYFERERKNMLTVHPSPVTALILNQAVALNNTATQELSKQKLNKIPNGDLG